MVFISPLNNCRSFSLPQITGNIGMVYSGMGPDYRLLIRRARKMAQVDTCYVKSGWKIFNFPSLGLLSYVPRDHPHGAVGVQGGAGYAGVHPVWWGEYCHESNLRLEFST